MPWIIDGHNLIPKIPDITLSMTDDEEQLIKLLIAFVRVKRKDVTVYFDNAPIGVEKNQRYGNVSVHYVRKGRSADEAIRGKLKQLGKSAKNWTVVSSDRAIQSEARSVGAGVISSEEFSRSIISATNDLDMDNGVAHEVYPDDEEVELWLEFFKREVDDRK
jgi:uncharacterized protein